MNKNNKSKKVWSEALKSFSLSQYEKNPIPDYDTLTDEEEWHYRIIGGGIVSWLENGLPQIFQERHVVFMEQCDPDPLIVLTSNIAGLVAVREIVPESSERIIHLSHTDFDKWEQQHQVDDFNFHIHHWNYFRDLDHEIQQRALQDYPSINVENFRIHTEGHLWGRNCGKFWDHLWHWNGTEMELLQQEFFKGIY